MAQSEPVVTVQVMRRGRPDQFDRAFLFCPAGHEVVSSPVTSPTGRRLVAGDFSRESCGYGSCPWEGSR